jgi:hypothetical protein
LHKTAIAIFHTKIKIKKMQNIIDDIQKYGIQKYVEVLKLLYIQHTFSYAFDKKSVYDLLCESGATNTDLFLCCPNYYIHANKYVENSPIAVAEALQQVPIEHIEKYLYQIPKDIKYMYLLRNFVSQNIENFAVARYCDKVFHKYQIPCEFDFETSKEIAEFLSKLLYCFPNYYTNSLDSLLRYKNLYFYFDDAHSSEIVERATKTKFAKVFRYFSLFTTPISSYFDMCSHIDFKSKYQYKMSIKKNNSTFGFTVFVDFIDDLDSVTYINFAIPEVNFDEISSIEKINALFAEYLKRAESLMV